MNNMKNHEHEEPTNIFNFWLTQSVCFIVNLLPYCVVLQGMHDENTMPYSRNSACCKLYEGRLFSKIAWHVEIQEHLLIWCSIVHCSKKPLSTW